MKWCPKSSTDSEASYTHSTCQGLPQSFKDWEDDTWEHLRKSHRVGRTGVWGARAGLSRGNPLSGGAGSTHRRAGGPKQAEGRPAQMRGLESIYLHGRPKTVLKLLEEVIEQGESKPARRERIHLPGQAWPSVTGKHDARSWVSPAPGLALCSPHRYLSPFPPQALTQPGAHVRPWLWGLTNAGFKSCLHHFPLHYLGQGMSLLWPWFPHLQNGDNHTQGV